jgi:septal ring factor EnvC (AmiA/AmiB activator)
LRDEEKRITTVPMLRQRRQTSKCLWAVTLPAWLCCFLPAALAQNGPEPIVTAQAKPDAAQRGPGKSEPGKKDVDVDQARRLFEEHQRNLEKIQQEQKSLESETKALETERAGLQTRLVDAGKIAQGSDRKLTEIETKLERLTAQEAKIRLDLNESRATIGQMLAVMQRMGREPPPVMATHRADALKMVRSAMVLSSFFPKFKEQSDKLAGQLADLDRVMTKSREQRDQLAAAKEESVRSREEIGMLLVERRERLKGNVSRIEDLKVAASRHTRAVTDLGDLLQRLDAEVAQHSNLAAYEAELKQLGPAVELKPEAKQIAFVQPGRMKPALPFDKAKGTLALPCAGKKIKSFGMRDETGGKSEGIVVETRKDAQIVSPSDGWVIYAGTFRSYGQLLIINAGGGYHILLAGMDQIYTSVGQFVLAGEPVAIMGKSEPQTAEKAQSRSPALYIEFRKDARPVDPDPWWSQGVKEG